MKPSSKECSACASTLYQAARQHALKQARIETNGDGRKSLIFGWGEKRGPRAKIFDFRLGYILSRDDAGDALGGDL